MQYSLKDLEQLTGVAWATLRQWHARGYIHYDGEGSGVKGDPCTFTEEGVYRVMWLAQMRAHSISVEDALTLWEEHLLQQEQLLLVTEEGATWVSPTLYEKKMKSLFEHHAAFFVVSLLHFYQRAEGRLENFERVKKMRFKIGIPTVERSIAAVH